MKVSFVLMIIFIAFWLPSMAYAVQSSEFCAVLRSFVGSVKPTAVESFTFRTSCGANFKDASKEVLYAKRCEHGGYPAAKQVCAYLMEHASAEFTRISLKKTISCLSPNSKFDDQLTIDSGVFSITYGTQERGALVDITFNDDDKVGGKAFKLVVNGY
jgi:hypothetical protein